MANPDEQFRRFGQFKHVRLYAGADYVHRVKHGGLVVERYSLPRQNGNAHTQRFGLLQDEDIFVARKTMSAAPFGHRDRSSRSLRSDIEAETMRALHRFSNRVRVSRTAPLEPEGQPV